MGISCILFPVLHNIKPATKWLSRCCFVSPHATWGLRAGTSSKAAAKSVIHCITHPAFLFAPNTTREGTYISPQNIRNEEHIKSGWLTVSQESALWERSALICLEVRIVSLLWVHQVPLLHAVLFLHLLVGQLRMGKHFDSEQTAHHPLSVAFDTPAKMLSIFSDLHLKTDYRYRYVFINKIWGIHVYIKIFTNKGVIKISSSVIQVQ